MELRGELVSEAEFMFFERGRVLGRWRDDPLSRESFFEVSGLSIAISHDLASRKPHGSG
jgi:hypothetical protein